MRSRVLKVLELMVPFVAAAGCAQILGIEDLNSGAPDTTADGGFPPLGDSGNGAACAPVPVFGAATNYSVGMGIALAVGDLNRDGVKDVVVATLSGDVVIFNGTGNGVLGPSRPLHTTATLATGVLIADVDGDGSNDVVTWDGFYMPTGLAGNDTVSVHRQNPTAAGTFLNAQSFSVPGVVGAVAGKLNADNRADLMIVSKQTTGTVPYFASTATAGTFTAGSSIDNGGNLLHVGDIDGDGLDDAAFTTTSMGIKIAFNDGGTVSSRNIGTGNSSFASFGQYAVHAAADRSQDVVIDQNGPGALFVQMAPRSFVLQAAVAITGVSGNSSGPPGSGMPTLDLNADGRDDVVGNGTAAIQCPALGTFYPRPNTVGMQIEFGQLIQMPGHSFVLSDLNANGKPDLIGLFPPVGSTAQFMEVSLQ